MMAAPVVVVEMAATVVAMVGVAVVAMDSVTVSAMVNATSPHRVQRKVNKPQLPNKRRHRNVKDAMNHVRRVSQEKRASRVHRVTPTLLQLHQTLQRRLTPMLSAHPKPRAKAVVVVVVVVAVVVVIGKTKPHRQHQLPQMWQTLRSAKLK